MAANTAADFLVDHESGVINTLKPQSVYMNLLYDYLLFAIEFTNMSMPISMSIVHLYSAEFCSISALSMLSNGWRLEKSVFSCCLKLLLLRAGSRRLSDRVPDRRACNSEGSTAGNVVLTGDVDWLSVRLGVN